MLYKTVHEQLLEAERADREARTARWREARMTDLASTLREVGRKLCEEDGEHPALLHIARASELLGKSR